MHVMCVLRTIPVRLATLALVNGVVLRVMCAQQTTRVPLATCVQMLGLEMRVIFALLAQVERTAMFV